MSSRDERRSSSSRRSSRHGDEHEHRSSSEKRKHKRKHKYRDYRDYERSSKKRRRRDRDDSDEEDKAPETAAADRAAAEAAAEEAAAARKAELDAFEEKIRLRRERWQAKREQDLRQKALDSAANATKGGESAAPSAAATEAQPTKQEAGWSWGEDELAAGNKMLQKAAERRLQTQDSGFNLMEADKPAAAMEVAADGSTAAATPEGKVEPEADAAAGKGAAPGGEEDDVDPLDAFMAGVNQEVTKIKAADSKRMKTHKTLGIVGMRTKRGERVFQNEDGLEYSSEEEEPAEQPKEYWNGYAPKQRRELGVADHSKIDYPPFKRALYVEVPEISRMTDQEVADFRYSLEHVSVRGKNCPRPIKTWVQCGVSKTILALLRKFKYEKPTPIQAQAIPVVMSGRDMIGIAKTGSGKTLAYVLPMLRHVMIQETCGDGEGPIAIILTPTRELCLQTYRECTKFGKHIGLRTCAVYGGTNISEQIADLKRGAEIIVCTPGRMIDMLTANSGRVTNTRRCTMVILDEADRMFDLGFEPQVMRILDNIRPDRQTVMFSATFPRQMEALARRLLKRPVEVQIGGRSVVSDTIQQNVVVLREEEKFLKLLELLGHYISKGQVLVFVEKQAAADYLLKECLGKGYSCLALHGGIDQLDRDSNISDFKQGNVQLMIATSVAARGLDVKKLKLVVNYDCPNHYEDYVHRVGRTGRAGKKGTSFTFVTEDEASHSGDVIKAMELAGTKAPKELKDMWKQYVAEHQNKKKTSGFGGKGFKFNAEEQSHKTEMKMLTLMAHGAGQDEGEGEENDDYKLRDLELNEEIESEVAQLMGSKSKLDKLLPKGLSDEKQKIIEKANALAKKLTESRAGGAGGADGEEGEAPAENATMKDLLSGNAAVARRADAMARASMINKKYGFKSAGPKPNAATAEAADGKFEDEIEINDFPQQARWKVTRKESVHEIQDFAGAAITVRGTYFPPGKKVKDGERKLYLFIEGKKEATVIKARAEIERILREELKTAKTTYQNQSQQRAIGGGGRYKVLSIKG